MGYRLVYFKRWSDEIKHLPMFLLMFALAIFELMVENFFVWCAAWMHSCRMCPLSSERFSVG